MRFLEYSKSRVLLFDGAMSTELVERGALQKGECGELLNITRPMDVLDVHLAYVDAGADVLTANTFGANPLRLAKFGLLERAEELIQSGIALCKEAAATAGREVFAAASIGPTGELYNAEARLPQRMYETYCAQCAHAAAAGADLLIIETMSDLCEARMALLAARASCALPVLVSFTLEPDAHTYAGNPPEVLALLSQKLGAALCGVNCGLDPEEMFPGFLQLSGASQLPTFAAPNACKPGERHMSPERMAELMLPYLHSGVAAIGGCCHTTAAHIRQMRRVLEGHHGHAKQAAIRGEYICAPKKRLPLADVEEGAVITLQGCTLAQAEEAVKAAAGATGLLHIDLGDWSGEDIRLLLFRLYPYIDKTPLAFHVQSARQANAALFAYPGIAALYVHGDADRVLKSAVRYGAEVIN